MLIHSIKLNNFLSFGNASETIPLGALNLLIGPNGSGKSNLLEAFDLLSHTPEQLPGFIRQGGGVLDWLWKGSADLSTASLEVVVDNPRGSMPIRYGLAFTAVGQRFELTDEFLENAEAYDGYDEPYFFYCFDWRGRPALNVRGDKRSLSREDIALDQSILAQRRDPDQYPEITYLARVFGDISLYREWQFGRHTPSRQPQMADLPNHALSADGANLGLVLNRLRRFSGSEDAFAGCPADALRGHRRLRCTDRRR